MEISGQQQVILQFAGRSARDGAEPCQLAVPVPAAALGEVGADGRTGAADLTGQTVGLFSWEARRRPVNLQGQMMSFLPHLHWRKSFMAAAKPKRLSLPPNAS